MMNDGLKLRHFKNHLFTAVIIALTFVTTVPLFLILFHLLNQGISSISWDFLVHLPEPIGETGGGISNAIVGTLMLVSLAVVVSVPIGISTGIYLSELRKHWFAHWVRLAIEVIQGIPSIVIGIIVYIWVVLPWGGFSALSGGIALGIMMLPLVIKSTEETLKLIPDSLKEASLALGVPYYRTILRVILPAGLSGISTGVILGVARIAGETAPLLFTAFGNPFMNYSIFKPVSSLPLLIYNYAISPYPEWHSLAWAASLILIGLILALIILSKIIARKWKIQF